jgi:putative oxidoreductase
MQTYPVPLGRLLMSSVFIWDGIFGLRNPESVAKYYAGVHVPLPDVSVWVVGIFQLVFGLAILVGYKSRFAAMLLIIFCLITAFAVHLPAGDLSNMTNFYKNLAMAGGLLYVVAFGSGPLSIDSRSS